MMTELENSYPTEERKQECPRCGKKRVIGLYCYGCDTQITPDEMPALPLDDEELWP